MSSIYYIGYRGTNRLPLVYKLRDWVTLNLVDFIEGLSSTKNKTLQLAVSQIPKEAVCP